MTSATHRQYSVSFAFLACMLLYWLGELHINYYLSMIVLLSASRYGALFPDVDHSWDNVKEKTVPNFIINKIIHITGGKHRSWQTHSIDIVAIFTVISYIIPKILYSHNILNEVNCDVLSLILFGFCSGWISHIFSDMLTSAGVRLLCWSKFKLKLVPKHIGSLKFNTGHEWESFCYKAAKVTNIALAMCCLAFPYIMTSNIWG